MKSSDCYKLRACPTQCPPRAVRREGTGGVRSLVLYTIGVVGVVVAVLVVVVVVVLFFLLFWNQVLRCERLN